MENKVVIKDLSGGKVLRTREVTVEEFRSGELGIDSVEHITENAIDRIEITIDDGGDHKEYKNSYDEQGRIRRIEINDNGVLSAKLINYDEDGNPRVISII